MALEIGVISGVIGISNAAYASCKSLHDLLRSMNDAPRECALLTTDLNEGTRVLENLNRELGKPSNGERGTVALKASLEQVQPCLKELQKVCDEFKNKLGKVFAHSTEDRTSVRDRFMFTFQDKHIASFRYRLSSYKETISIALALVTLKTSADNTRGIKQLEETVESTSIALAGQIKGMEISIQTLVESGFIAITSDKDKIVAAIEDQKAILEKCLTFCVGVSAQAAERSGNNIRFAKVQDEAKQLIGNIGNIKNGGPAVVIDELIAHNKGKQMAGSIEGNVALIFMGESPQEVKPPAQKQVLNID